MDRRDKEKDVFIQGFGISGYRSFGAELQRIGPFKKINVFIGSNNAGKSNVLRFLWRHYGLFFRNAGPVNAKSFEPSDFYATKSTTPINAELGFSIDGDVIKKAIDPTVKVEKLKPLIKATSLFTKFSQIYLPFILGSGEDTNNDHRPFEAVQSEIIEYSKSVSGQRIFASFADTWLAGVVDPAARHIKALISSALSVLRASARKHLEQRPVYFVPQFREIQDGHDKHSNTLIKDLANHQRTEQICSGLTAIIDLARLQNPGDARCTPEALAADRKVFAEINEFVRELLGDPQACIQANFARDTIIVDLHGKVEPLESLGTGIHQVILFAIIFSQRQNSIFCIEEPENHLHPTLLRKLLDFMENHTSNQYFISTHSPVLIDNSGAAIFSVRFCNTKKQTLVECITADQKKFEIVQELGFKPSDLLQTNFVIWVEGPSDRIYIQYWISQVDNTLVENGHYSFVIYGGALKSYLTTADHSNESINLGDDTQDRGDDLTEDGTTDEDNGEVEKKANTQTDQEQDTQFASSLIEIRKVCRQSILITDSDSPTSRESQTKRNQELQKGFQQDGSHAGTVWVTCGRTIENYIPAEMLNKTLSSHFKNTKVPDLTPPGDWWVGNIKRLSKTREGKWVYKALNGRDKVKLANAIIKNEEYSKVWDKVKFDSASGLRVNIENLCHRIRFANGLPVQQQPPVQTTQERIL